MKLINGSCPVGARRLFLGLTTAAMVSASAAQAETIFTINGVDVDSAVVDMYFNSRLANQAGQATPQQREVLMGELRDIYVLATQDNASDHRAAGTGCGAAEPAAPQHIGAGGSR